MEVARARLGYCGLLCSGRDEVAFGLWMAGRRKRDYWTLTRQTPPPPFFLFATLPTLCTLALALPHHPIIVLPFPILPLSLFPRPSVQHRFALYRLE